MLIQAALKHAGLISTLAIIALGILSDTRSDAQEKIVATINNEGITEKEFYTRLQHVKGQDFLVPTTPPAMRSESAGYILLNALINQRLIIQLAQKNNVLPTDAEINGELEGVMKQEGVIAALKDHSVTKDDLFYDVKVQVSRFNLATGKQPVSAEEVEKFYNDNIERYKTPERWGLSAIRTTNLDTAIKVIGELKAGKSFETTAKTFSEDQRTRDTGGQIGVFDANDKNLPQEIRSKVALLKLGENTEPIGVMFDPGNGGAKVLVYWIVKLTVKQDAVTHSLAEIRPQIERLAALKKYGGLEVADKKIAEFRKTSDVVINLPGYDALTSKK
jgi:PPIC-type PPIASE domain/SurA N-terminal domain